MQSSELLEDAFGRVPDLAHRAVDGLDADALRWQIDPGANTIAWLVWHLTRVQDDHVAELAGREQVWLAESWAPRFGLPDETTETGYGHSIEQVRAVRPDGPDALLDYLHAVTEQTLQFVATVGAEDLDRIVDRSWDPPVTMGMRLVSVIGDCMEHVGQAAYLRGVYDRTAPGGG